MRRFFLALGVRLEVVARPLPDVVPAPQRPPEGRVGDALVGDELKDLPQQGHRPTGGRVAEVLGRDGEEGLQQVFLVLVEQRGPATAGLVGQRGGVAVAQVRRDPVVDALAGDAEHAGNVSGGAPEVELQDREGAAVEAGVRGASELTAELPPLPGCEVKPAHALLLLAADAVHEQMPCQNNCGDLLSYSFRGCLPSPAWLSFPPPP